MKTTYLKALAVIAGSAALATVATSAYVAGVAIYSVVLALLALSVGLTFRWLGYVSFGHAAFLGIGAYTAGLISTTMQVNYWLVVPLSIVPGLLLGGLVGLASARLGGAYFAIASLTLAEILRLIVINWVGLTRGPMGLMVMVPPLPWADKLGWGGHQAYLFVLLLVLGAAVLAFGRLIKAPLGRQWRMIREAPDLAESVGVPTLQARVMNIAMSGGLASLAGGLLVPKILVLSPDLFGVHNSAAGLLAVILGGKATLIGPVIGGLLFGILPELLRAVEEYRMAIFAGLLLIAVRVLPDGLTSLIPRLWGRGVAVPDAGPPGGPVDVAAQPSSGKVRSLQISGLSKHFHGVRAVDKVSFSVQSGELLGIIGPNGAGKTTCFSMLSGFLEPSAGKVQVDGRDVEKLSPNQIAAMGLIRTFQQTAYWPSLTVEENVFYAGHLLHPERPWAGLMRTRSFLVREADRMQRARTCLDYVGLSERRASYASDLSYGEQKLLGVAIALAAQPSVLLLDEPAAGLNHTEGMRLARVLTRLKDEGCTIVIIDHNLKLMMSICDRLVVLQHGEKIAEGSPSEVSVDTRVLHAYLGAPQSEGVAA